MKKIVKLNESQLNKIISESVKKVLKESKFQDAMAQFDTPEFIQDWANKLQPQDINDKNSLKNLKNEFIYTLEQKYGLLSLSLCRKIFDTLYPKFVQQMYINYIGGEERAYDLAVKAIERNFGPWKYSGYGVPYAAKAYFDHNLEYDEYSTPPGSKGYLINQIASDVQKTYRLGASLDQSRALAKTIAKLFVNSPKGEQYLKDLVAGDEKNEIKTLNEEKYDKRGFGVESGRHRDTGKKRDPEGYDRLGFDREGYDREGFNQAGYNREGFNKKGFDKEGFNKEGFNKKGINRDGLSMEDMGIEKPEKPVKVPTVLQPSRQNSMVSIQRYIEQKYGEHLQFHSKRTRRGREWVYEAQLTYISASYADGPQHVSKDAIDEISNLLYPLGFYYAGATEDHDERQWTNYGSHKWYREGYDPYRSNYYREFNQDWEDYYEE